MCVYFENEFVNPNCQISDSPSVRVRVYWTCWCPRTETGGEKCDTVRVTESVCQTERVNENVQKNVKRGRTTGRVREKRRVKEIQRRNKRENRVCMGESETGKRWKETKRGIES